MKVRLLKQNRIDGKAGDIVEVSPDRAAYLFEFGMAAPVTIREQIEAPEKKTAKRTTRTKK
jgi:ribosomal protein L9